LKIILAVHHFPPNYTGGAEWEAYHAASGLQARGHQVKVVCIEDVNRGPENGVRWEDDEYHGLAVRRLSFNRSLAPDPARMEYDNAWIGQHFEQLFEEFEPDAFHIFSGYLLSGRPIWTAEARRIPIILTLEDFWFLCPRITLLRSDGNLSTLPIDPFVCAGCLAREKRRYQILGRAMPGLMQDYWRLQKKSAQRVAERYAFLAESLKKVNTIISRSQFLAATYIQAGAPAEKFILSRQGLDLPSWPADKKKAARFPLRIGFLGQIAWHKGIHVLLEAVRSMPDAPVEVKVFGNLERFPAYTDQLRRIISGDERLSLAGSFNGAEEEHAILGNLDVIVVPSVWYENSPNVILESFAFGTPIIASNLGGMAELVQHGKNGLLFEAGNSFDLARQINRLIAEPTLLPSLQGGISPVKRIEQEVEELEKIYQALFDRDYANRN
jgi:glycosyltransferase involved in cell wall biosynthesis